MVTLVAMSRLGETSIVRGSAGDAWLVQPEMLGGVSPLAIEDVDREVARGDLLRLDRTFTSWDELAAFRQQFAARETPVPVIDADEFDAEDVRRLLVVARAWVTEGRASDAIRLALDLVELTRVRADDAAVRDLVRFVRDVAVDPATLPPPDDHEKAAARERWHAVHAVDATSLA